MLWYILKRLCEAVPTLFVISLLTFFMVRLAPGDPFSSEKASSPEIMEQNKIHFNMVDPDVGWTGFETRSAATGLAVTGAALHSPALRASLPDGEVLTHLNGAALTSPSAFEQQTAALKPGTVVRLRFAGRPAELELKLASRPTPLLTQYKAFITKALQGDFGPSLKNPGRSVSELLFASFPHSLELGLLALAFAVLVGVSTGMLAAWRPNTWTDYLPMGTSMLGVCLPAFVFGPILVLIFSIGLGWFNPMGWNFPSDRILPTLTLGFGLAALLARLTRGSLLEVRNQDYMRTARAKGLSEARIMVVHGLRNGLLPVVSYLGPAAAGLVSGSFVTENIFGIPGLGKFFVTSAMNKDMPVVMGTTLFFATLLLAFNFLTDILMAWLNPRLKLE